MDNSNKILSVRLDEDLVRQVEAFAVNSELLDDRGNPNVSAALRVLISLGLKEPASRVDAQLWQSAKGAALRELSTIIYEAMKEYRDR